MRRAEPEQVPRPELPVPVDAVEVDEDPGSALGAVDRDVVGLDPEPGVDRAHGGQVEVQVAIGIGSDQHFDHYVFDGELLTVKRSPEDRQ